MTEPRVDALPADAGYWSQRSLASQQILQQTLDGFKLPPKLQVRVLDVTQRTKLWQAEQIEVAKELAGHFRDGLDSGATPEHLIERFGDVTQAAKMIRRARIRCRPLHWQIRHYGMLTMALLFGPMLVCYGVLAIRFFTAEPTISRNYFAEINAETQGIPVEDRAWPIYRKAILMYDGEFANWQGKAWEKGNIPVAKGSEEWNELVQHINRNRSSLSLLHQGTQKPILGYVYGDPANEEFLQKKSQGKRDVPTSNTLLFITLPQNQHLREMHRLLYADWYRAIHQGDGATVAKDVKTLLKLAPHHEANGFVQQQMLTYSAFQMAIEMLNETLDDHPKLLTDHQLIELAQLISNFAGGGTLRASFARDRQTVEDLFQRCFTDDGAGDGRLTPEGLKILDEFNSAGSADDEMSTSFTLSGPALMALVGSRKENHDLVTRLFDRDIAEHSGPMYTWGDSSMKAEIDRLMQSFTKRTKYMPALLFIGGAGHYAFVSEHKSQLRDGVLTAIAVELFRRENGHLPKTLNELVPKYLGEVPIDRLDGKPIKYAVKNNRPVIYSVGMDGEDNGGKMPIEFDDYVATWQWKEPHERAKTTSTAGQGFDWVLFPRYREQPNPAN